MGIHSGITIAPPPAPKLVGERTAPRLCAHWAALNAWLEEEVHSDIHGQEAIDAGAGLMRAVEEEIVESPCENEDDASAIVGWLSYISAQRLEDLHGLANRLLPKINGVLLSAAASSSDPAPAKPPTGPAVANKGRRRQSRAKLLQTAAEAVIAQSPTQAVVDYALALQAFDFPNGAPGETLSARLSAAEDRLIRTPGDLQAAGFKLQQIARASAEADGSFDSETAIRWVSDTSICNEERLLASAWLDITALDQKTRTAVAPMAAVPIDRQDEELVCLKRQWDALRAEYETAKAMTAATEDDETHDREMDIEALLGFQRPPGVEAMLEKARIEVPYHLLEALPLEQVLVQMFKGGDLHDTYVANTFLDLLDLAQRDPGCSTSVKAERYPAAEEARACRLAVQVARVREHEPQLQAAE